MILPKIGRTVPDVMKGNRPVAHPGGPAIFAGMAVGLAVLWMATYDVRILAMLAVISITFAVGIVDDLKVLPGPVKVLGTIVAALPILLMGAYQPTLSLPLVYLGRLTIIYPILVLAGVPVAANAVNMIDIVNGAVSGVAAMVAATVAVFETINGNYAGAEVAALITAAALGFWLLHRYPSRILPGDSGSLVLGAAIAALAISYKAEVVATVALLPEALNGFFILSSVRSLAEHRKMRTRPTVIVGDSIVANEDPAAPITLARLLSSRGPLKERDVGRGILALQAFSCALALLTGLMIVL
jgi:UDP-N-acetylglucosamine--dolichyl-phosphate N-acetylglucosaminephosphotransferase